MINPSVCVSVCLSASISLEPLDRSSRNFVCRSAVAVARSSSGGVALRHVFPVLRMTSRLAIVQAVWRCVHGLSVAKYSPPRDVARPERSLMSVNALLNVAITSRVVSLPRRFKIKGTRRGRGCESIVIELKPQPPVNLCSCFTARVRVILHLFTTAQHMLYTGHPALPAPLPLHPAASTETQVPSQLILNTWLPAERWSHHTINTYQLYVQCLN